MCRPSVRRPARRAAGQRHTARPGPGWSCRCPERRRYGAPRPTPAARHPCGRPCLAARGTDVRDRPWPPGTAHAARHEPDPRSSPTRRGLAETALTGPSPSQLARRRSSGPSLTGGCVVRPAQPVLRPPPTPSRPVAHFPRSSVIGRHAPATPSADCRAGEGLPSSRRHYLNVPRPIRRESFTAASRIFTASMAFAPISKGSALPRPTPPAELAAQLADRGQVGPSRYPRYRAVAGFTAAGRAARRSSSEG
jgi:hypothetical protein